MTTLSGFPLSQYHDEFASLLAIARRCRSYLEIGARQGDSWHEIVTAMPPGSLAVAVDLPNARWGLLGTQTALLHARDTLRAAGYLAHVILSDSHEPDTVAKVKEHQPVGGYDLVYIDADHTYPAVRRDWELYGPIGKVVAFHDILRDDLDYGVHQLWRELRADPNLRTTQAVVDSSLMGVGIVWREDL